MALQSRTVPIVSTKYHILCQPVSGSQLLRFEIRGLRQGVVNMAEPAGEKLSKK